LLQLQQADAHASTGAADTDESEGVDALAALTLAVSLVEKSLYDLYHARATARDPPVHTAMHKLRIRNVQGLASGDRKRPLNEAQIPHFRIVRVALCTGYYRAREIGGRRESAAKAISHPEPLPLRFATFASP
jgi:hypothetical protein